MPCRTKLFLTALCMGAFMQGRSQTAAVDTASHKVVVAGAAYQKSKFYQWLWGYNRRKEWAAPVDVRVLWLDSMYGGLKPYQQGGGNESKSLRLKTAGGKEYALRSINKSREEVVLPEYKHTFIEDIIKDGVSMSYPYGAFAVPELQKSAGIPHTIPLLVYVPKQAALDTFSEQFGNDLYLLEQRPDGDWSDADNLGNFKEFSSTDKVIEKLQEDNHNKADQFAFVKSRLFDMLISDWDRHEDNWRWGVKDTLNKHLYIPVPRDRDQAFYTHNGVIIDRTLPLTDLGFMQNFDYKFKDINILNLEERNMDRFFSNEMTLNDWLSAAKHLQQSLNDENIARSIRELPPEIFAISGNELIEKLKSRREQLLTITTKYYLFVAKQVEITGSKKREHFEVKALNTGETLVQVFRLNENGVKEDTPFYRRTFRPSETKEIRLYGIGGEDVYAIHNPAGKIKLRVIGGYDNDSIMAVGKRIHIYDDDKNIVQSTAARLYVSPDSAIHAYKYDGYNYNKSGFSPSILFNYDDHWFVGINYHFKKYKWRRDPYATQQSVGINYSFSQKAFSASYAAMFPNIGHHWNVSMLAKFDAVRFTNFYGLGNDTKVLTDRSFYNMRSVEWLARVDVGKEFGKSSISVAPFYQRVKLLNDSGKFVSKPFVPTNIMVFEANNYGGIQFTYTYLTLNDSIVPTNGFTFMANATYARNFQQHEFFQNYDARVQGYVPLGNKLSLAIRVGAETVLGNSTVINNPQSYEHAVLGGPENLRGYKLERFWGKTSFYNNNELRFITNMHTHLMNAKIGLLAFFDDGRVWMPSEISNTIHTSYGGGLLLAPFHKVCATLTYGISEEAQLLQFRINKLF
jgi:hypothetical protein